MIFIEIIKKTLNIKKPQANFIFLKRQTTFIITVATIHKKKLSETQLLLYFKLNSKGCVSVWPLLYKHKKKHALRSNIRFLKRGNMYRFFFIFITPTSQHSPTIFSTNF